MAKAVTTRSIPSRAHHGMTAAKASQQRRVLSSLQQLHAIAAGRGAEESRAGVRGGSIPGGPKDARCFPQLLPRALAPRPSKQRPLLTTPAPLSLITFSSSRCRRSSSRPDVLREACAPAPPGYRELSDYMLQVLESVGYSCFWQGAIGLAPRATSPCVSSLMSGLHPLSTSRWSNLVCSWRPEIVAALDAHNRIKGRAV